MRNLNPTKEALDFIRRLEPKQFKQLMSKLLGLLDDPTRAGSSTLRVYESLYKVDIGEHQIIYRFNDESISLLIVDKRNDDEVYKKLARKKF